jgi:hypothetical protein
MVVTQAGVCVFWLIQRDAGATAVTCIPVAVTSLFIVNHAKDAVDIITAATRSMANAGISLRVFFIFFLLFEKNIFCCFI